MKCDCGSTNGLSKHVPTHTGWLTLTRPMCVECRIKKQADFLNAYSALEKRIEEREAVKGKEETK